MTGPRILAVIPARAGSKGLSGKNIRPLAGLPLIAHSIRAAALTDAVTRCVVSTDSEQIATVAREYGGETVVVPGRHPVGVVVRESVGDPSGTVDRPGGASAAS